MKKLLHAAKVFLIAAPLTMLAGGLFVAAVLLATEGRVFPALFHAGLFSGLAFAIQDYLNG